MISLNCRLFRYLRYSAGITTTELMAVMVIVAVVAVVSLPQTKDWTQAAQCRKAAREIISVLRTARSQGITTNCEHRVEFDALRNRYRIMKGNRARGSNEWIQVAQDWTGLDSGVTMRANIKSIQYNTNGTANGGTIRILDSSAKERIAVVVNRTGRVRTK